MPVFFGFGGAGGDGSGRFSAAVEVSHRGSFSVTERRECSYRPVTVRAKLVLRVQHSSAAISFRL